MIKRSYTLYLASLFSLVWCVNISAQTFVCNNQINVTVNTNCAIDLTVDAMLEGDTDITDDILNGLYTFY